MHFTEESFPYLHPQATLPKNIDFCQCWSDSSPKKKLSLSCRSGSLGASVYVANCQGVSSDAPEACLPPTVLLPAWAARIPTISIMPPGLALALESLFPTKDEKKQKTKTNKQKKPGSSCHGSVVNESDLVCGFDPWACSVG